MPLFGRVGRARVNTENLSSLSLDEKVKAIIKKSNVFEGKSYIIINEIKKIKNSNEIGWKKK